MKRKTLKGAKQAEWITIVLSEAFHVKENNLTWMFLSLGRPVKFSGAKFSRA